MTPAASVVNSYVITSNCFGPGFEVKQLIQCGCLCLTDSALLVDLATIVWAHLLREKPKPACQDASRYRERCY